MLSMNKLLSISATAALLVLGTAHAEMPQINDARIIQPPPGSKVAAAYFTVNNTADTPLIINSASSDTIDKVEVHLSFVENDVARMEEQESVTVPAGESLEFKHGSYHIMFMGLEKQLEAGSHVNVVLETSAGSLPIVIPVLTPDEADANMKAMGGHDMDSMHKGNDMDKMDAGHDMKHGDKTGSN